MSVKIKIGAQPCPWQLGSIMPPPGIVDALILQTEYDDPDRTVHLQMGWVAMVGGQKVWRWENEDEEAYPYEDCNVEAWLDPSVPLDVYRLRMALKNIEGVDWTTQDWFMHFKTEWELQPWMKVATINALFPGVVTKEQATAQAKAQMPAPKFVSAAMQAIHDKVMGGKPGPFDDLLELPSIKKGLPLPPLTTPDYEYLVGPEAQKANKVFGIDLATHAGMDNTCVAVIHEGGAHKVVHLGHESPQISANEAGDPMVHLAFGIKERVCDLFKTVIEYMDKGDGHCVFYGQYSIPMGVIRKTLDDFATHFWKMFQVKYELLPGWKLSGGVASAGPFLSYAAAYAGLNPKDEMKVHNVELDIASQMVMVEFGINKPKPAYFVKVPLAAVA